jgi:hypothetical protein
MFNFIAAETISVLVDGVVEKTVSATNIVGQTLTVSVPTGSHSISVTNTGIDWVEVFLSY